MELLVALCTIVIALTLGAMSPGPSFLFVARTAVALSRRAALAAALGMGVGGVLFAVIALLGLFALFAAVPLLYVALKAIGGGYLLYLGYRIWRAARVPLATDEGDERRGCSSWRFFLLGLGTQVSNPKTALIYAGVFAALLPRDAPPFFLVALPAIVFVIETGWYAVVAWVLSAPPSRARYLASKAIIDRLAGTAMAAVGARLVLSARTA